VPSPLIRDRSLHWDERSLRIVMPIYRFFPVIMGGAEQQALRLAKELVAIGHTVTILTGWWDRNSPRQEVDSNVIITRHSTLWGWCNCCKPLRVLRHYIYEITLAFNLWRDRKKYDVIHVHQALHAAVVASFMGKLLSKPVLVKSGCGGEFGDLNRMKSGDASPFGDCFWKVIKKCDAMVAISDEIADELRADGFPEDRLFRIPNGISCRELAIKYEYGVSDQLRVVSVGRLVQQKGMDVLVAAVSLLESKNTQCFIYGEGEDRDALSSRISFLGLSKRVFLPGVVHDVLNRLPAMDIFVLSSRSEGLSNALLEAMAIGMPCIGTNIGGNRDLISPRGDAPVINPGGYAVCTHGILVNPEDPIGLSNAIAHLQKDHSLRNALGRASRDWIKDQYSISSVAEKYLSLYHTLLNARTETVLNGRKRHSS